MAPNGAKENAAVAGPLIEASWILKAFHPLKR
jgi:hypothetical protein